MQVCSLILVVGRTRVTETFGEARSGGKEFLLDILVPKLNTRTLQTGCWSGGLPWEYLQETCGGWTISNILLAIGLLAVGQSSTHASAYVGQFIMRASVNPLRSYFHTFPDVKGVDNGPSQNRHCSRAYFMACGCPDDGD
ncbi:hypothetical protein VNO77_34469 [Canavalia gladiata]|uniref:Uncharacterized protein n=1 Tax=Canavalia gladiata TaxID=3824 RepID=A0AAN9PZ98_CANGL